MSDIILRKGAVSQSPHHRLAEVPSQCPRSQYLGLGRPGGAILVLIFIIKHSGLAVLLTSAIHKDILNEIQVGHLILYKLIRTVYGTNRDLPLLTLSFGGIHCRQEGSVPASPLSKALAVSPTGTYRVISVRVAL